MLERSRLVGPIEELRFSLADFRRLAQNPADRIKKIESKIRLLESDSFVNKYLGIRSWMSSEVFQNYILLGERALQDRVTLAEVQQSLLAAGKNVLTKEEFVAVGEANGVMRR
ncbi:MAG: Uncharacterized protein Greene101420_872 [Parcubacteria group bacterium Greene1014_20]|nr:MAG: Uncharacterized protein Greene101420_872 [Parcubacteria group bacterium Greene1014_20]